MKQQIISLLERAKENGTTIGDVLAEVRGMRPVCTQHAESKLEWITTPDIRDVPDCVLTPRGVALKQSQISVAEEAQDVKLPEIPSAYNDTGGYVGYAKSDLAAYARAAVMADRASRPARPEPTDAELATLASEFMMSGSCSTRYYFDDRGFARALLARYGAQPAASAEPVAFYKDGVLFWHGEHAAWRGKDGQLYAEPTAAVASAPVAGEAIQKAKHDTANADTERDRVKALAYWLDQQTFEPGMLSCAAATLRAMFDRDAVNELVAAEYNRWIRAHAAGQSYDTFLIAELAAQQGEGGGA